jgi:hypothetical protein
MNIPFEITIDDLKKEPVTPVGRYAHRFHHRPPLWYYRWLGEEQIDAVCRKALEEDRPVRPWAIVKYGSWAWDEPHGKGLPEGVHF